MSAIALAVSLLPMTSHASEDIVFHENADLRPWLVDQAWDIYDGSIHNSTSDNIFEFNLPDSTELNNISFYAASGAPVQNNNRIVFNGGSYRTNSSTDVFHAAHDFSSQANRNIIEINGGTFLPPKGTGTPSAFKFTFAAANGTGNMSGNQVLVTGGDFQAHVLFYAANDPREEGIGNDQYVLSDNLIKITGGNFIEKADAEAAHAEKGTLIRNKVQIENLQNANFAMIYAAHTQFGNAYDNVVEVKNSDINVSVSMYAAEAADPNPSVLVRNRLSIENSSITTNGFAAAYNGSGDVLGNIVEVYDSTIQSPMFISDSPDNSAHIYVFGGQLDGEEGISANVTGNIIRLKNVKLDITKNEAVFFTAGSIDYVNTGSISNNAIELYGDGSWDERLAKARLIGARRLLGESNFGMHDNALRLIGWRGELSSIKNFDSIELSNIPWKHGDTVLEVAHQTYDDWGDLVESDNVDLSRTQFVFADNGFQFEGGPQAHLGESMTLVHAGENTSLTLNPEFDGEGKSVWFTASIDKEIEGHIVNGQDGKTITVKLEDAPEPSRQLGIVSNNRNMSITFLGQAGEIIGDTLALPPKEYQWGPKTFAMVNGADVRYDSSGKLSVHGVNFIAGAGTSVRTNGGGWRVNFFAELGRGQFGEQMHLGTLTRTVEGSMDYYGIGTSARRLFESGFYAEGSLRLGRFHNDVESGLLGADGRSHGYDVRTTYGAAHAGIGMLMPWAYGTELEFFAKYFYLHLPSDSATVRDGDDATSLHFEAVDNSRVRTGMRWYAPAGAWQGYLGAAYEYDFTPDARNEANGVHIEGGENLRGSTGIGEMGFRYSAHDSGWLVDLRLRGYCGQRKGGSLKMQAEYAF